MKDSERYDVLIIGAGASGLVCAQAAAARGLRTAVLERNDIPAKKIYATGNGRCNFTNEGARFFSETVGIMSRCFGVEAVMEEGRGSRFGGKASRGGDLLRSSRGKGHIRKCRYCTEKRTVLRGRM